MLGSGVRSCVGASGGGAGSRARRQATAASAELDGRFAVPADGDVVQPAAVAHHPLHRLGDQLRTGAKNATSAWGATIATLLAYQGLHVIALLLIGLYLCARAWCGHLTQTSRATLDNTVLMWHYTTLQGIAASVAIHLVPKLMG